MKLRIYLFRHGQTTFNRDKRFTGLKDPPLTGKGVLDARRLAQKLKSKRIDAAFSSSTKRSRDTLREVLKFHPECRMVFENNLVIERSYGTFEGRRHKEIIHKYGMEQFNKWHRAYSYPPPGGESVKMVEKRVISFIRYLTSFMKKNKVNVAISAHGNSMRPFRRHFENLTIKQMTALENPWDDYFEYTIEA